MARPDGGGDNLANDVMLYLSSPTGRTLDEVEIGDDEGNDGTDGAPHSPTGNDGQSSSAANESVGRCPNGRDTDVDDADFFQDEVPGFDMASTDQAEGWVNTNVAANCPPCANGADDDTDGWLDLLDPGCADELDTTEADAGGTACSDGVDNGDGDGLADANDPDCFSGADNDEAI